MSSPRGGDRTSLPGIKIVQTVGGTHGASPPGKDPTRSFIEVKLLMSKRRPAAQSSPSPQPEKSNIFALGRMAESSRVGFLPMVRVELLSNKQAVVDGCKGILEYSDSCIRLSADRLILKFTGRDLEIKCLTDSSAVIEGFLLAVEYQ